MTDLILAGQEATMSTVEIAELTGKRHDHVMFDARKMLAELELNAPDFTGAQNYGNNNTREVFNLDKDLTLTLVSGYNIKMRHAIIVRWQELESNAPALPQDLPTALRLYADQLEITASQEKLIAEQKPKALFADAVTSSASSILVGQLAKLICQNGVKVGQNRLFVWLRNNGYLIKQHGENFNLPTQRSMDGKWLEVKERVVENKDGSTRVTRTTKVTGKGQVYFINKFLGEVA